MLRQTPPLAATEAFIAAARASSFRAAAASLALSPSAFSRRIQMLEAFLGTSLFDRTGAVAELTETGRRYLAAIEPAIDAIRQASAIVTGASRDRLRVATSHSFAVEWLVPRLAEMMQDLEIDVDVVVAHDMRLLRQGEIDLAIWGGLEPDNSRSEIIVTLDAMLVAPPRLADGREPPDTLQDLVDHRILTVRNPPGIWGQWLFSAGFQGPLPPIAATFETNQMLYESAASGLGVTLAVPLLSDRFLADGRLAPCVGILAPTGMAYRLHHANPEIRRRPAANRFAQWLTREASKSKRMFESLASSAIRA